MHGTYEAKLATHGCDLMLCVGARFERFSGKLKDFRSIITRYDKLTDYSLTMVKPAEFASCCALINGGPKARAVPAKEGVDTDMRFKGLDLNLLCAFDTLMRTRSVSRTAEEMNLSQPAISSALKRLRDYFGDAILIAHNKRMLPTAYAESLVPQVRDSLRAIEGLIATSTRFDPATSHRTFRLAASDYMATAIFAPLSRKLAREAPGVQLELILNDEHTLGQLDQGAVDLLVMPEGYTARDLPAEHLLDERHVIVGWRDNPLFLEPLDEPAFLAAGHVQVAIGSHRTLVFGDRELNMMGKRRRVEIIASSFAVVPWLLVETRRLALMHERLALVMAELHPIAMAEIPFTFPVMREMIQYHPARAGDPGLIWLRERLQEQAQIDKFK